MSGLVSEDDDTKDLARAFRKMAEMRMELGDVEGAQAALDRADAILGRKAPPPDNVHVMTDRQLKRRGRAIAAAKAATPLHEAAATDPRFGSIREWARIRGFGRSSVAAYAKGIAPCPSDVDKAAREDFPGVFAPDRNRKQKEWRSGWVWPRGVVD